MRVKWTQYVPLSSIPECYWGEDLTLFDTECEGEVIGTTKSFWGITYLVVNCNDNNVREVNINNVKIISN